MSKLNDLIQELCPDGVEYKNIDRMIKEKILILISPSIKVKKNTTGACTYSISRIRIHFRIYKYYR